MDKPLLTHRPIYQQMLTEAKERRRIALRMRQEGTKFKEIGAALGVTTERARQMVNQAQTEMSNG